MIRRYSCCLLHQKSLCRFQEANAPRAVLRNKMRRVLTLNLWIHRPGRKRGEKTKEFKENRRVLTLQSMQSLAITVFLTVRCHHSFYEGRCSDKRLTMTELEEVSWCLGNFLLSRLCSTREICKAPRTPSP